MTEVTIKHNASERMSSEANQTVTVKDARGRSIALRKPKFFEQFDFIRALGSDAENSTYRTMVSPLLYVDSIDGAIAPTPTNSAQIKALLQRLDEDGYTAVVVGIQANFNDQPSSVKGDELKNS